jgi:hypothetical protein
MPRSSKTSAVPDRAAGATPSPEELELARAALLDITPASTIGDPSGASLEDDGVLTVYLDTTLGGYPGWRWTVSIARVEGEPPTVLEAELTPGEGALLSPDWVPWSERLAEYQEAQAELAAQNAEEPAGDDHDHDEDDDDDLDEDDAFDGVDIDALGSDLPAVGHDEAEETEGETDDAGPEPPVKSRRNQRAKKQQKSDEGE